MNDREMLELAAKAAGYDTSHPMNARRLEMDPPVTALLIRRDGDAVTTAWDPLTDDGAALRLAVKLGICVVFIEDHDSVAAEHSLHGVMIVEAMDDFGTRRAIVRAAADIAKATI